MKNLQEQLDADYKDFYYENGKYRGRKLGFEEYKKLAHARDLKIAKAVIVRVKHLVDWETLSEEADDILSELEGGI